MEQLPCWMWLAALLSRKDFTLQFQVLRTWVTHGGDASSLVRSSPPRFSRHSGGSSGEEPSCQCQRQRGMGWIDPLEEGVALQCSCLENPMDRGRWWATVHGVAKSWTQLKWLSTQPAQRGPYHVSRRQERAVLFLWYFVNYHWHGYS